MPSTLKYLLRVLSCVALLAAAALAQTTIPLQFNSQGVQNASLDANFSFSYATDIVGGQPDSNGNYSVTLTAGTLPPGLTLTSSGANYGTVAGLATTPGSYTFTLTATDSSNPPQTASQSFTISVKLNPFTIEPALSGGVIGHNYADAYVQGGTPPYTWSIPPGQGSLPPGLTLSPTTPAAAVFAATPANAITGTPTTAGTFSFTLQATDSSSPTPQVVSQAFTITVLAPPGGFLSSVGTPNHIAASAGPLWFTYSGGSTGSGAGVEGITTAGSFQNNAPIAASPADPAPDPTSVTVGPDGNIYAVDGDLIQRVTPGGTLLAPIKLQTTTTTPEPVQAQEITTGKDGGVWFTGTGNGADGFVGRIDPASGNVQFYKMPTGTGAISGLSSIIADPDGTHLWFLGQYLNQTSGFAQSFAVVGRITTNGVLDPPAACLTNNPTSLPNFQACFILNNGTPLSAFPPDNLGPAIALDHNDGVWFQAGAGLARLAGDGTKVDYYPLDHSPQAMVWAPDNALWYVASNGINNDLYRFNSSNQGVTLGIARSAAASFNSLTVGQDGALWLTSTLSPGAIVRVVPSVVLNCNVPTNLEIGVPVTNAACTAAGGIGPYTYQIDSSHSAPGITVSSTGSISGTPTGSGYIIITANDSSSPSQQASQVITIQAAPLLGLACNFPATGSAGQPYSGTCSPAGGTPPYTYSAANLPAGLTGVTISPTTANGNVYSFSVSGTLSTSLYGAVSFTVTATDSSTPPLSSSPQTVNLTVAPIPVTLSCAPNATAIVGKEFEQTCYGVGGVPPYTYGSNGGGLAINATTGLLSGTETVAGPVTVNVAVKDSQGQGALQTINLNVINPKLALICNLPFNPTAGAAISVPCSTSGGTAPYAYSVSAGALPAGLTFNATSGLISGTLTGGGPANFTLLVTDSTSATVQQKVSILVHPTVLSILSPTLPAPQPPLPYAAVPLVLGGTPPYQFTISAGALPVGLTLDAGSGSITNVSGATAATITPGAYSFTLTVTDSVQATASQPYSGTILATPVSAVFNSYAIPGGTSGANGITAGPDGNLWFTTLDQAGGNLIGSITPAGVIKLTPSSNPLAKTGTAATFELPVGGDIAAGPDGEIWVAQQDAGTVAEVALDQSTQLTYVPTTQNAGPNQITPAPDGTLWFTEAASSKIAHVGADGNVIEFPTATPAARPYGIVVGPDNFMIYTEAYIGVNKMGVISQDGTVNLEFPIPTANSIPTSVVMGPDSALWFTEFGANKIGRMDFGGGIIEIPVAGAPEAITLGPDGALYFTLPSLNQIGRITPAGDPTYYTVPDANSQPVGIVAGPDGALWFTESNLSKIGRLNFVSGPVLNCTLPTAASGVGAAFTGACTASQGTPPYQFSLVTAAGSTPPPGVVINATTGALSGTLTTAGTFNFAIQVTDSSNPPISSQQTYSFSVTPLPLTLTCNTPGAYLYTAYAGAPSTTGAPAPPYGCTVGNTGTPPYTYTITSGTVPPGLTFASTSGNITGSPTTLGAYPFSVQVTDSSSPVMTASQGDNILVQYGTVTSTGGQLFTLSTPPLSVLPGSTTPGLTLIANEALLQAVTGTAVLTFAADPAISGPGTNTPATYIDPALQFVTAGGGPLSTTYAFTFPAGGTSLALPAIDAGTVNGTIELAINASGLPQTATLIPVASPATGGDVIEPGSVQFTNKTSAGFDIEFVATVPTRGASSVTVTFNPASGDQITGQQTFIFNVTNVASAWFSSSASFPYGGRLSLTIPFVFNGQMSAIGSATVIIDGSAPVTGGQ